MDGEVPSPGGRVEVVRARESGGTFPNIGDLFQDTFSEYMDAIGPYLLSFLGLIVGVLGIGFVGFIVFGVLFTVVGLGLTLLSSALEGTAGATLMTLVLVGFNFLVFAVFVVGSVALTAPVTASYMRAVAAHQRGDEELGFGSAFGSIGQDAPQVILAGLLVGAATFLGLLFCVIPVVAVPLFLGFTMPLVALHGMSATDAARANIAHVRDHIQEHVVIALIIVGLNSVAGMIPVAGPAFVSALTVRVYRKIFGDGDSPQLAMLTDGAAEI